MSSQLEEEMNSLMNNPAYAKGFAAVPAIFLEMDLPISAAACHTYTLILWHARQKNVCWPGIERLAKMLHCTNKTASKHVQQLIDLGLIKREQRSGTQTDMYTICPLSDVATQDSPTCEVVPSRPLIPPSAVEITDPSAVEITASGVEITDHSASAVKITPPSGVLSAVEMDASAVKKDASAVKITGKVEEKYREVYEIEIRDMAEKEGLLPPTEAEEVMRILGEDTQDRNLVKRYHRMTVGWKTKAEEVGIPFFPIDAAEDCKTYFTTGRGKRRTVSSWTSTFNNWCRHAVLGFQSSSKPEAPKPEVPKSTSGWSQPQQTPAQQTPAQKEAWVKWRHDILIRDLRAGDTFAETNWELFLKQHPEHPEYRHDWPEAPQNGLFA